jgi:hypothetical protein
VAKEKFLIIAIETPKDCFSRFSETANIEAIKNGTANSSDPYSWIVKSFEIVLIRWREATHLCSFTPSAYYVFLQNAFAGTPNGAWARDEDPSGLEYESGGEPHGYADYRDDYDPRFVCDSFVIDTVKQLNLRKPSVRHTLSRRTDQENEALGKYRKAIWSAAEETASEIGRNGGFWCDALNLEENRS